MSTNTTFTLIALGTSQKYHKGDDNILKSFAGACVGPIHLIDGPDLLGREVADQTEAGVKSIIGWLMSNEDEGELRANLTGFSRGAVTCVRIANRLNALKNDLEAKTGLNPEDKKLLDKLKRLEFNLFLVDPVAGYTAKGDEEAQLIRARRCITILQRDERRRDFKPQATLEGRFKVVDPQKTSMIELPMYGNHSDSIKEKSEDMDSAPHILWPALYSFLTSHGSTFEHDEMPDMATCEDSTTTTISTKNEDLCNEFGRHHLQREKYYNYGIRLNPVDSLPTFRVPRKINQHLKFYVRDSDFFINKLEQELFKITYPRTFNYLFEMNKEDPRFLGKSASKRYEVEEEIQEIKKHSPALYEHLKRSNKINEDGTLVTDGPTGSPLLESLSVVQMIYPDKLIDLGFDAAQKKCNDDLRELEKLTLSIYRLTFLYQRGKSSLHLFKKRTEDARAQTIRNDVLKIVEENKEPENVKREMILRLIYREAMYLRLTGSKSQLIELLDQALEENGAEPTSAPENEEILNLIHEGFQLIDWGVYFIATGGYVGGAVLSIIGTFLGDMGNRIKELSISTPKDKASTGNDNSSRLGSEIREKFFSSISEGFIAIGKIFKMHFGLKLLREEARAQISKVKDESIASFAIEQKNKIQLIASKEVEPEFVSKISIEETPPQKSEGKEVEAKISIKETPPQRNERKANKMVFFPQYQNESTPNGTPTENASRHYIMGG